MKGHGEVVVTDRIHSAVHQRHQAAALETARHADPREIEQRRSQIDQAGHRGDAPAIGRDAVAVQDQRDPKNRVEAKPAVTGDPPFGIVEQHLPMIGRDADDRRPHGRDLVENPSDLGGGVGDLPVVKPHDSFPLVGVELDLAQLVSIQRRHAAQLAGGRWKTRGEQAVVRHGGLVALVGMLDVQPQKERP